MITDRSPTSRASRTVRKMKQEKMETKRKNAQATRKVRGVQRLVLHCRMNQICAALDNAPPSRFRGSLHDAGGVVWSLDNAPPSRFLSNLHNAGGVMWLCGRSMPPAHTWQMQDRWYGV